MDDEDEFLYGDEAPTVKKQKTETNEIKIKDAANDKAAAAASVEAKMAADISKTESQQHLQQQPAEEQEDEEDEEEYESDESDIDIIIDTKGLDKSAEASAKLQEQQQQQAQQPSERINIDEVATIDGKPLTDVDLEKEFAEKPWRKPGADITDYFNFGFDEFTWTAYCAKQKTLRDNFSPEKIMTEMMNMSTAAIQESQRQ